MAEVDFAAPCVRERVKRPRLTFIPAYVRVARRPTARRQESSTQVGRNALTEKHSKPWWAQRIKSCTKQTAVPAESSRFCNPLLNVHRIDLDSKETVKVCFSNTAEIALEIRVLCVDLSEISAGFVLPSFQNSDFARGNCGIPNEAMNFAPSAGVANTPFESGCGIAGTDASVIVFAFSSSSNS